MKLFLSLIAGFFFSITSFSQFVTIPDAGFVSWLTANYATCMTGNDMDTTCINITSATSVNIQGYTINDLEGMQYFDNLSLFKCAGNSINTVPFMPQNLTTYQVGINNLTSIPNIPSTVTKLEIYSNPLSSLPALPAGLLTYNRGGVTSFPVETTLPAGLTSYTVSGCNVVNMPPLPNTLTGLIISGNPSLIMPPMPPNLESLQCTALNLSVLPPLPNTLILLNCSSNNFTVINNLPPALEVLTVSNMSMLDSIYNLPNTITDLWATNCNLSYFGNMPDSITSIYLTSNSLTELPIFPPGIMRAYLANNQLTEILYVPTVMLDLLLNDNNLYCLPTLPSVPSGANLDLSNNPFTCIPNYTNQMTPAELAFPLCDYNDLTNNPQGCSTAEGIAGFVYEDANTSCTMQTGETGVPNVTTRLFDMSMNQLEAVSSTVNGRYFITAPLGTYNVIIDTLNKPYMVSCATPGTDSTVVLNVTDTLADNVNFGIVCKPGFDVGTNSVHPAGWVFPGQNHTLKLNTGDISNYYNLNCAAGVSGTVTVTVTGPVSYVGILAGSLTPTVAGLVFSYTIADFGMVDMQNDFGLEFETSTLAQVGDQICVNINVTPITGDNNTTNNDVDYCYQVVNSYDPNNKLVYPSTVEPGYDDYLTYTINFQNTGSAPAFDIRLEDTLSSFLDLSTFEVIDYSHSYHYALEGNNLTVYFPNIMLIDSTTNEPESKGHITYRIKPISGLVNGDMVENTAYIYFDFNAPIMTNTAVTEYFTDAGFSENSLNTRVYPTPFEDELYVDNIRSNSNLVLRNILGETIWTKTVSNNTVIDGQELSSGVYFLTVVNGNQSETIKLIRK